MSTGK